MAKKINNTEDTSSQSDMQSPAVGTIEQVMTAEPKDTSIQEAEKTGTETDETTTGKQEKETKETALENTRPMVADRESPNPHTLELLKKFPADESLYVDSHGGTFSPDTPAAIRRDALLYKNPFYNELKRQS